MSEPHTAPDWDAMVLVGRIVKPHGNRGQVLVASESDFAEERFAPGCTLWIQRAGQTTAVVLTSARFHDGRPIVGLAGVESINDAEPFRGCELRVPLDALPTLAPGQFWHHDLVGCRVATVAGVEVGQVIRIDDGAGAPTLVVAPVGTAGELSPRGALRADDEILVPMVDAICRRIDVAGKLIEIDPMDGLLDINQKKEKA